MTQTSTATQIIAQLAEATERMQALIAISAGIATRERQERRINALKAQLATL